VTAPSLSGRRYDGVVIGASAGGVEALSVLLPALARGFPAAVFVVLHLPRERPSLLVQVFQPRCALRVCEAVDKEPVTAGTIYFAPPDYHLLVDAGPQVALSADELVNYSRPSVDVLFESAADVYGERLLGIVLTGASHDGAAGAEAIERAGGTVVVQRPDSAQSPAMAEAALRRVPAAARLALGEIAELLRGVHPGEER
jgi:two-component system, chemotaxis family, protein-glutamate methylesterase/glutaminase